MKIKDIRNFIEGNLKLFQATYGSIPEEEQEIISKRIEICNECPELVNDPPRCNQCGCGFPTLTYSLNKKCPLNKW